MHYVVVFLGGGLGAALRHGVNRLAMHWWGTAFPFGTLLVNVIGCLAMGLLVGLFAAYTGTSQQLRLFFTVGLLGGFTTFSAFGLDALTLWQRGEIALWLLYVGGSVILSLIAVAAGYLVSERLF